MKKYFLLTIAFLFFFIALKAKHNYVEAELISEVKSIQPGKDFWVALKLDAKPEHASDSAYRWRVRRAWPLRRPTGLPHARRS